VKSQIIGALEPLSPKATVRGQYEGYLQVPGVAPDSTTETYVAIGLAAQSWRWADVPILIRAGKCLPVTATEVVLRFRKPPHDVFGVGDQPDANNLRIRIYPDDRIGITVLGKKPGPDMVPQPRELAYSGQTMQQMMRPYDRLIGAALNGERYLFARQETVEAAWRVVQPVLGNVVPVVPYPRDTWGPAAADSLLPAGGAWHNPAP
jgi:glucose-6-phosphate 1-dehydrogenase